MCIGTGWIQGPKRGDEKNRFSRALLTTTCSCLLACSVLGVGSVFYRTWEQIGPQKWVPIPAPAFDTNLIWRDSFWGPFPTPILGPKTTPTPRQKTEPKTEHGPQ